MKIITFVIPCYNSQAYMEKCINSLLPAGDDIEIIIVNDGSTDNTAQIADRYQNEYPDIVRAVHKPNGGHGSGVNTGLKYATGEFFKVVDSDDWVDGKSLEAVMTALRMFIESDIPIDMMIANYVYEHVEDNKQNRISYAGIFPQNKVFTWDDMIRLDPVKYIIMHSVIHKTKVLRDCGVTLPEHTFYVDNILLYQPLPYIKKMYYLNVDFYRYYTGRPDQSVNIDVMTKRIDQQLKVNNILLDCHNISEIKKQSPKLARYMAYYLSVMYTISTALIAIANNEEADKKRDALWKRLRERDTWLYRKIRYFSKAFFMSLPGSAGKKISVSIYKVARKVYKFN